MGGQRCDSAHGERRFEVIPLIICAEVRVESSGGRQLVE